MIIRANNYKPRNNSEYFIVDRQYTVDVGRFDLTGFFWDRNGHGNVFVYSLMESGARAIKPLFSNGQIRYMNCFAQINSFSIL
jgi:hypothetical protein